MFDCCLMFDVESAILFDSARFEIDLKNSLQAPVRDEKIRELTQTTQVVPLFRYTRFLWHAKTLMSFFEAINVDMKKGKEKRCAFFLLVNAHVFMFY